MGSQDRDVKTLGAKPFNVKTLKQMHSIEYYVVDIG